MKVVVNMLKIISELESSKNEFCRLSYDFSKLRVLLQEILVYAAQSVRFCFCQQFSLFKIYLERPEHEIRHTKFSTKTNHAIFRVHKR